VVLCSLLRRYGLVSRSPTLEADMGPANEEKGEGRRGFGHELWRLVSLLDHVIRA